MDLIDFDLDEVFGVFNRRLGLVAMAHLAYLGPAASKSPIAEFGVSVATHFRGRGYASTCSTALPCMPATAASTPC